MLPYYRRRARRACGRVGAETKIPPPFAGPLPGLSSTARPTCADLTPSTMALEKFFENRAITLRKHTLPLYRLPTRPGEEWPSYRPIRLLWAPSAPRSARRLVLCCRVD